MSIYPAKQEYKARYGLEHLIASRGGHVPMAPDSARFQRLGRLIEEIQALQRQIAISVPAEVQAAAISREDPLPYIATEMSGARDFLELYIQLQRRRAELEALLGGASTEYLDYLDLALLDHRLAQAKMQFQLTLDFPAIHQRARELLLQLRLNTGSPEDIMNELTDIIQFAAFCLILVIKRPSSFEIMTDNFMPADDIFADLTEAEIELLQGLFAQQLQYAADQGLAEIVDQPQEGVDQGIWFVPQLRAFDRAGLLLAIVDISGVHRQIARLGWQALFGEDLDDLFSEL